jgi:hypothetical protein
MSSLGEKADLSGEGFVSISKLEELADGVAFER